jgi:hypothetical protein
MGALSSQSGGKITVPSDDVTERPKPWRGKVRFFEINSLRFQWYRSARDVRRWLNPVLPDMANCVRYVVRLERITGRGE